MQSQLLPGWAFVCKRLTVGSYYYVNGTQGLKTQVQAFSGPVAEAWGPISPSSVQKAKSMFQVSDSTLVLCNMDMLSIWQCSVIARTGRHLA